MTYLEVLFLRLGVLQFGFEAVDFTLRFLHFFLQLLRFRPAPLPFRLVHPQFGQGPPQLGLEFSKCFLNKNPGQ